MLLVYAEEYTPIVLESALEKSKQLEKILKQIWDLIFRVGPNSRWA
jgi:hypothetical protein